MSLEAKGKNSSHNFFKQIWHGKRIFYISIATIPFAILLFYGIEDKTAWFFGHDYIDDYRYRISNNVVYHLGAMVSHYALVVTLSIVGILISWIIYEACKLSNISLRTNPIKSKNIAASITISTISEFHSIKMSTHRWIILVFIVFKF